MADSALPSSPQVFPASDLPEALQAPTRPVSAGFTTMLTLANSALYLCYAGVGGLLLPLQVLQLDPANKVTDLGLITGATALLALVANPVAGALSDRTAARWGRRRPWIFVGGLVSALALAIMMTAQNVPMLALGWSIFQVTSNFILAAVSALIPDQVPEAQRGRVSGIVGLATALGGIGGAILIGQVLKAPVPSYAVIIPLVLLIFIGYTFFLREKVLPREAVPPFHLGAFLKNFWVNPVKHSDFGWAWLTRFLTVLGYFMGVGYLIYYLQDVIKYPQLFPGQTVVQGSSTATIVGTLVSIISTVLGGFLSDKFQRRKIFVLIASVIMTVGILIVALFPSWTAVLVGSAVLGLGFGMYMAVDVALITQVLPSANDRAKDLGIINIANTLPQSLAPVLAAFLLSLFHSYSLLFIVGALIALLSGLLVQPIKSVR